MTRHVLCKADAVCAGKITAAKIGRAPVILSRLPSGKIWAASGRCPHQGASLEFGCISGTTCSDKLNEMTFSNFGETLRCPWHGFEYSLIDGRPLVEDPTKSPMKLRLFDVAIEDGDVVVTM
jgi:nitrite reductase (NADH) small subunit